MHYFVSETASDGSVYSCDKICIKGKFDFRVLDSISHDIFDFLISNTIEYIMQNYMLPFGFKGLEKYFFYEKMSISSYRNNFNIILSDGNSFYFAYKLNSEMNKEKSVSWKIELNPNKCLPCDFVSDFLNFIYSNSKPSSIFIFQLDIAIDIRTERFNVYLEKDRRVYTRIDSGSDNVTEYLSKHNEHGFVKLYNKTAESNLDYTLTRLEITLKEFYCHDFQKVFPSVHVYSDIQVTFDDDISLSQNDEVFVALLRLHPEYFNKLTFRKQQKLGKYISDNAPLLQPDINAYVNLIEKVREAFYVPK